MAELGFHLERVNGEIHGSATVVPEMYVPGTRAVRTSIFASWTDVSTGYLAVDTFAPRVPTTLELDVHLLSEERTARSRLRCRAAAQSGPVSRRRRRSTSPTSSAAPSPSEPPRSWPCPTRASRCPAEHLAPSASERPVGRLRRPFAERARCERIGSGRGRASALG